MLDVREFKPARLFDGRLIAVMIGIEIGFSTGAGPLMNRLQVQVPYGFFSPPAMTSLNPIRAASTLYQNNSSRLS
jgi:hypothetical protein